MSDEIIIDPSLITDRYIPCVPAESDPKYIKHIRCEGARFHILSWSNLGTNCSESRCIINKPRGNNE